LKDEWQWRTKKSQQGPKGRRLYWWEHFAERVAMSRVGTWYILNVSRHIDPALARLSRGRFSIASLIGAPLAVLTTIGAKSGLERTMPLLYVMDGDNVILIASYGGRARHPGWYYNLRANPGARLFLCGREQSYIAHEAQGDERDALWAKAADFYAGFPRYQERAGERQIPVMVLVPKIKGAIGET
jgi:deazaflavin-dependent oxidoreductase (nitroreductase family)